MDPSEQDGNGNTESLPPPPPIPTNVTPLIAELGPALNNAIRHPMARPGRGSKGNKVPILTNHFKVNVKSIDGYFFHYSVALFYEDGRPVDGKGVGRKLLDRVQETYDSELAGKVFAYDGEKSLFTVGPLPRNKLEFTVVLDGVTSSRNNGNSSPGGHESPDECDRKRIRRPYQSKTFKVEISFAAKIPMRAIGNALRGQESENSQEALRVLDIVLRQHAARQGSLLVRQSYFHNDPKSFAPVGGGVLGCRGFHSSFRTTQSGLSLNIDVSTTMIIQPGPLVDFLIENQNAKDPFSLDWAKAKHTLKNLRVKTVPTNQEYKITGLSEKPCREQMFTLKLKDRDKDGELQTTDVTVYDYFVNHRNIDLRYSADLPCINVGKPKRPTYIPVELCSLVSLKHYTKALTSFQRASLVEKSRQKPQERMSILSNALKTNNYNSEPMLCSSGISIASSFTQVEGRILPPPKLKAGDGEEMFTRNGKWNFNNKKFIDASKIERWAVVNFSARCDVQGLIRDMTRIGEMKGIKVEAPFDVFEENSQFRGAPPFVRVEKMLEEVRSKLPGQPKFLLCLLPKRKNCDIYGPWKQKNLSYFGIITQCLCPMRVNDKYLTNLLLKINTKLGGLNTMLAGEISSSLPVISKIPTLILGTDESHGSPGQSDIPSIAALCSLVSLQRYTKALTSFQRASLVEKSRQKPQERMLVLSNALKTNNYDSEPMLRSSGISIASSFTQVEGRILPPPKLKAGNGEELFTRNGKWNFNNKKFIDASKIERWAVVNFSARCDVRGLIRDMTRIGERKGIKVEAPFDVFEENSLFRHAPPLVRVEKLLEEVRSKLPGKPKFLLCLLPERKNCDIYGPWKRKNLSDFGIITQCLCPMRVNDQYLTNLLLKINAKLGGLNTMLAGEISSSLPVISKIPTLILGMDVSHGSPGQSDIPSIAAVVSSRQWPSVSRYRACVRTQSPKVEMIDSLFKPSSDTEDEGIIRELLMDFYISSGKRKPDQIIIFRDGVSESQFNQVLNIELNQIIEACKFLDEKWSPKFVVIVAQKNHHTKFFQPNSPENVRPGTVIDNTICHPKNFDFYLCAHAGMIGTTRPTHYHVLLDQIGLSADDLQELVHSLSYVYQRSTTAISVVAPICYAHLAATQLGTWMKFEEMSETSSSHNGGSATAVPPMPKLQENVRNSMFFV